MKKLFTNDLFFLLMTLLAVLGNIIFSTLVLIFSKISFVPIVLLLLRVACVVALYFAYRYHNKNLMKGLMGALLMAQLTTAISWLSPIDLPAKKICAPIFVFLSFLLLVNHLIINSDRYSSPNLIKINQLILVLLVINQIAWSTCVVVSSYSTLSLVRNIFNVLGFAGMIAVIVCIESRLDAYRQDREEAGWDEEKGYPEGYVHEFEKNKK